MKHHPTESHSETSTADPSPEVAEHPEIAKKAASDRVVQWLAEAEQGDRMASEQLLPLLYVELRRLAAARLAREKSGQTLQPTALVHEAYLRLIQGRDLGWQGRGHFFGAAAEAMRRILIERARKRRRPKHGGDRRRTTLDDGAAKHEPHPEELLALDRSLSRLEARDSEMAQVVKLRYFAGLTVAETAAALEISERQVNRHWTSAKAWLQRDMSESAEG